MQTIETYSMFGIHTDNETNSMTGSHTDNRDIQCDWLTYRQ